MMVKIEPRFTLEVDYDEAYLLRAALIGLHGDESMSKEGNEARLAMLQQIEGLLSLASGVTADGLPFLRRRSCSAGVGGGEVCMRSRGHVGAHDQDSAEVQR